MRLERLVRRKRQRGDAALRPDDLLPSRRTNPSPVDRAAFVRRRPRLHERALAREREGTDCGGEEGLIAPGP